ncbi:MAG: hypothetical protein JO202_18355 [Ktedonobacteraceae bacterium]|nr:hypothetical protein [Ktedonobacteraceae bacterium]
MIVSDADLHTLATCCVGRRDDYAVQRADGSYCRVGRVLSDEVLRLHLAGVQTIGSYVIDEEGFCRFAVFDADREDGLDQLLTVQSRLRRDGIASYLEGSRRGGHLHLFLAAPVSTGWLRTFLVPYCPAGVELYPKQERASYEHPGSLMRVPLGVHRRSLRRYPFVRWQDGQFVVVAGSVLQTLAWLRTVERVTVPAVLSRPRQDVQAPRDKRKYPSKGSRLTPLDPKLTIRDWCLAHDPVEVIGCYVALDERGMGCCPFGWHHSDGRDSHPSLWVYQPRKGDLCCWYCHVWQRGGSLFDFLRYYHGLDARTLWQRIRSGERF